MISRQQPRRTEQPSAQRAVPHTPHRTPKRTLPQTIQLEDIVMDLKNTTTRLKQDVNQQKRSVNHLSTAFKNRVKTEYRQELGQSHRLREEFDHKIHQQLIELGESTQHEWQGRLHDSLQELKQQVDEEISHLQADLDVVHELRNELINQVGKKVQLVIAASPPSGRPPNITGEIMDVKDQIIKLKLSREENAEVKTTEAANAAQTEEAEPRIGIYQIHNLIGFVPVMEGDCTGEGAGKTQDPLTSQLKQAIGTRIQIFTVNQPTSGTSTATGVLTSVAEGYITLALDIHEDGSSEPGSSEPGDSESGDSESGESDQAGLTAIFKTSDLVGFTQIGQPGGQTDSGKVRLEVTVTWPVGVVHRDEVAVTLVTEDVSTTMQTIGGVATFVSEPTGSATIRAEDVPGFITPSKTIKLLGNLALVSEQLAYEAGSIPVESVVVEPTAFKLLIGEERQLSVFVSPANANDQVVFWQSNPPSIATVNGEGLVRGLAVGNATITVTTQDGGKTAASEVSVFEVTEVADPSPLSAIPNELIVLPQNVIATLNNGEQRDLTVKWFNADGAKLERTFLVPEAADPSYTFTGRVDNTDLTVSLVIHVDLESPSAIRVTGVQLDILTQSLYEGESQLFQHVLQLHATVFPETATTKDVLWASSNEAVAKVSATEGDGLTATVDAEALGSAVILVATVDGGFKAYCQVSVSAEPEIELIYPTQATYSAKEDVVINVQNLVATISITDPTTYYVKVEQSGQNRLLGEGQLDISPDTIDFNLYDATQFKETDNYSATYFVYMSTDPSFPHGNDMTLRTNFKIGSAVPVVPKENIHVRLQVYGGPREGNLAGIRFLLARELDKELSDTTWQDYCTNPDAPDEEKEFTDEVKLKGLTNVEGMVVWEEPSESLKLGGYVLLEVTPPGYVDNLNLLNPASDQELFKAVQLVRDGEINREMINTYAGQ